MKKKMIVAIFYSFIVLFFLTSLFADIFCFPFLLGFYNNSITSLSTLELIAYLICSLFVYAFLLLCIKFNKEFSKNHFSEKLVKTLFVSGIILTIGSFLFFLSNIVFLAVVRSFGHEVFFIVFGLIGIAIGAIVTVVSSYIKESVLVKQENEEFV